MRGDRLRGDRRAGRRRAGACGVTPSIRSGISSSKRSSGPAVAWETAVGIVGQSAEHAGDVLERLALQQPGQQQVALLPQGQLVVEIDVVATRQQPAGLELDQGGGDQQELGGDVEVELCSRSISAQVGVDDLLSETS